MWKYVLVLQIDLTNGQDHFVGYKIDTTTTFSFKMPTSMQLIFSFQNSTLDDGQIALQ